MITTKRPDFKIILQTLQELQSLELDPVLLEAVNELIALNQKKSWQIDIENHSQTSATLLNKDRSDSSWGALKKTALTLKFSFQKHPADDFFELNRQVLGLAKPSPRTKPNTELYPFPDPQSLLEGLELIQDFIFSQKFHELFARIAFIQALNSLHPFEDGNGRTCRLLMDHWLCEMNLPPMKCRAGVDFLIANPTNRQVYNLNQVVTTVILNMQRQRESFSI